MINFKQSNTEKGPEEFIYMLLLFTKVISEKSKKKLKTEIC